MGEYIKSIVLAGLNILNGASVWLVISFVLAGVLHEFLSPKRFQKMLGNTKFSSLIKATLSGMLLPICSCGVIPLALSLYYSGAYLGPTLAFMTAAPIINPIAVILSYGLLGPQITLIYIIAGFTVPIFIGLIGNYFGGNELRLPGLEEKINMRNLEFEEKISVIEKLKTGFLWVIGDMGLVVSKYVILGMLLAGFLLTVFPITMIEHYLGAPSVLSLGSIAILAAAMYVCAVGHIPFIAALVASGASPGVAITFLMAGTATNLPELISIYKIIGKRTMIIYSTVVTGSALIFGYIANSFLMPNFKPAINYDQSSRTIQTANKLLFIAPDWLKYLCSLIIFVLFLKSIMPKLKEQCGKCMCFLERKKNFEN